MVLKFELGRDKCDFFLAVRKRRPSVTTIIGSRSYDLTDRIEFYSNEWNMLLFFGQLRLVYKSGDKKRQTKEQKRNRRGCLIV